ncbi:hypothetical protein NMG60_11009034 [Bertholletia excelsa]
MQASTELTSPSSSISDQEEEFVEAIVGEFGLRFGIDGGGKGKTSPADEEDEQKEEDFSFAVVSGDESPVSADDVFQDGQIKPIFPLFDRSLLFSTESVPSRDDLPLRPAVNKVFVEAEGSSGKAVEASPEICKKSNSTGFSKLWRFRDLLSRSNSDGRDAYVFLNSPAQAPTAATAASSSKRVEKVEKKSEGSSGKKVAGKASSGGAKTKAKTKKGGKGEVASLSAYLRSRTSKEEDRRRSYLPYRPELVGFFTNAHGGLSKNVHPF